MLKCLASTDRGALLPTLMALGCFGLNPANSSWICSFGLFRYCGAHAKDSIILERIFQLLLVQDVQVCEIFSKTVLLTLQILLAALDCLYHFSALPDLAVRLGSTRHLISTLANLLGFDLDWFQDLCSISYCCLTVDCPQAPVFKEVDFGCEPVIPPGALFSPVPLTPRVYNQRRCSSGPCFLRASRRKCREMVAGA